MDKKKVKKFIKQYSLIALGTLILDIGFYFFLNPAKIVSGGMLGIATIIEPYLKMIGEWFTPSIFLYIVNFICLILAIFFVGKDFFFKTIFATILLPTFLFIFEKTMDPLYFYNTITNGHQTVICLVCGALLYGVGLGIAIKYNGSTGGMDVIQKMISKFFKVPLSSAIYVSDGIVVFVSGFMFNPFGYNIEMFICGIVCVIVVAYIVDFIALSLRPRRTLYVITHNPNEIKELIYKNLDRGVTFSDVIGGFTGDRMTMVICTMDKNEAYKMTNEIVKIDPHAFTFVTSCKEVRGEYERRGLLK